MSDAVKPGEFAVFFPLCGGHRPDCIGTTCSQIPVHFVNICSLAAQNRFVEARKWQEGVCKLVEELFTDGDGSTHKSVVKYIGLDCANTRPPDGCSITPAEYDAYMAKVEALGFVHKDDANPI